MNWKSYSFGCLTSLALLFLFFLSIGSFAFWGFSRINSSPKSLQDSSYLLIELKEKMVTYRQADLPIWQKDAPLALNVLREKLKTATNDPKVAGIILKISGLTPLGYSQADELVKLLQNFKSKSGKKIFAYIYSCTDTKFLVASCANKIFLSPSAAAGISFLGINAKKLYFKTFLQKIGVNVKVLRTGDYKSYGETFSRDEISQQNQAETKKVYGAFFNSYQKQLSDNLNLPIAEIKSLFTQKSAIAIGGNLALKVVDSLAYFSEFLTSENIKEIVNINDYLPNNSPKKDINQIAVVYLQGSIVFSSDSPSSEIDLKSTQNIFEEIKKDKNIKAVVLQIDSPGGSALAAHLIASQVIKKCKIPVVVSMGSVAASGGYYIASASDYIVAAPYTITGSIGVCALLPNVKNLGEKLGIHYSGISYGNFAQSWDIWQTQSPQLISAIQLHINKVYQEFCYFVAKNRNLPLPKVKNIAQGKIYTAEQAKKLHLIDEVGYLEDAIDKAKELSKIDNATLIYYPNETNWLKNFLQNKMDKVPFLKSFFAINNSLEKEDYVQARMW